MSQRTVKNLITNIFTSSSSLSGMVKNRKNHKRRFVDTFRGLEINITNMFIEIHTLIVIK